MGKVKKVRKQFNYNKNRKKEWQKKKKQPNIGCEQVKNAWDDKKSVKKNLNEMGLSVDPNKTIRIPKTKDLIGSNTKKENVDTKEAVMPIKLHVMQDLEREACLPEKKTLKLSDPDVRYCIYMMEKYGEDYGAMARDRKNYYQDTPKQIRKKINTFKGVPEQYKAYLEAKKVVE